MMLRILIAALVLACLPGCSARTQVSAGAGTSQSGVRVQVEGGRGLATLFGLTILASSVYMAEAASAAVPEMAPDRKVSEQDCTRPLDYSLGNIRCK